MSDRAGMPASYDNWRTGGDYREVRVIVHCKNGHAWPTKECTEYGNTELLVPECPECKELAEDDTDLAEDDDE